MNKLKLCSKIHSFIIISAIFIAIGMAVGTICHFVAGGFFNYGGEFASYRCVTVTYDSLSDVDNIKPVCEQALGGFNAYEVSYADTTLGGEIVYKYSVKTDAAELQAAVDSLNASLTDATRDEVIGVASLHEATVNEGGERALKLAAIALASAAAFQFLYFIFRYKLRAAFSALLSSIHNLGIFVALAAITRIPLGAEMTAIGASVLLVTMIINAILFDRTRKNFKSDKYAKTDRIEVVELSASETRITSLALCGAIAAICLVIGAFAAISALYIGAYAPYMLAVFGAVACCYGCVFFTPAVHGAIDGVCEKVLLSRKASKPQKAKKASKTEVKPAEEKA